MSRTTVPAEIQINLDGVCSKCGKKGTLPNGYCMDCITKLFESRSNETIEIGSAKIKSVKADLIRSTVDVTIRFALNPAALALRERLATLGVMEEPVKVSIERLQRQMDFKDGFEKAAEKIYDGGTVEEALQAAHE